MVDLQKHDNGFLREAVFTALAGAFFNDVSQPDWHISHVEGLKAEVAIYIESTLLHMQESS